MTASSAEASAPATSAPTWSANTISAPPLEPAATVPADLATLDASSLPSPARAHDLPEQLGRFAVQREIGRGGMGRVLEARDPALRRTVALKVLLDPSRGDDRRERFIAEAQLTSQLEHPHIVPVHEIGQGPDGEPFFVMKKVGGRSLRSILEELRQSPREANAAWGRHRLLTIFVQVCHAVAYAHDRGVLHRDLKPENVMVGSFGEVLVMDWGVARLLGAGEEFVPLRPDSISRLELERTADGSALGTPGYMSPEQARGEVSLLDGRSDVWSLGAILYELLTGTRAYTGPTAIAVLLLTVAGPPPDPRERAPDRRIPEEIALLCLRCLAVRRDERPQGAAELAQLVDAFLAGSRRQEHAAVLVARAWELWPRWVRLREERVRLQERERILAAEVPGWAPMDSPRKVELWTTRRELRAIAPRRASVFAQVIAASEGALARDPGNPDARSALARVYWERFLEAEAGGESAEAQFYVERVREYDDGSLAAALEGSGSVSLSTDPEGALVWAQAVERGTLRWSLGSRRLLGQTPLVAVSLGMGSWVLTLEHPGRRDTIYPVHIERGTAWDAGPEPIPLFTDDEIGAAFRYVPAGPARLGGDARALDAGPGRMEFVPGFFIAERPVTMAEWCAYVNELHLADPERAFLAVPRSATGLHAESTRYWTRPEAGSAYVVPVTDAEGDPWAPNWPVFGVDWHDAQAHARWRTERDGRPTRLPTEVEWEKAARGVDGRSFPWGDDFEPTFTRMRDSLSGRPYPADVGSFPADRSVYGVLDLAGNCRCWCGEEMVGAVTTMRAARGGSWYVAPARCRSASRTTAEPSLADATLGVRLVRDLPRR